MSIKEDWVREGMIRRLIRKVSKGVGALLGLG